MDYQLYEGYNIKGYINCTEKVFTCHAYTETEEH